MNVLSCDAANVLLVIVQVYTWVLIAYAVLSWIPELQWRFSRYLAPFVEPLLRPLRRVIPPMGGFDISFLVLILAIQFIVRPVLFQLAAKVCFG